jgi:hypothetical protein
MPKTLFLLVIGICFLSNSIAQGVSVNTDASVPDASAIMDIKSINKGVLIPRMTLLQRDAISNPATGLMIFQTDSGPGFYYNAGTSIAPAWQLVSAAAKVTYRWACFQTYDDVTGWAFGNDASLFGGIYPSNWTDANALAYQISPNKDVQRTLFQKKGYAKENAMIIYDVFSQYSSTNGEVCVVMFRINNSTGAPINWIPSWHYSAYSAWGETASVSVNGANTWSSGSSGSTTQSLSIPSGQVSTVIFVSTSGAPLNYFGNFRNCRLAFYNNSLVLPAGLQFVDDLDTATGGWAN